MFGINSPTRFRIQALGARAQYSPELYKEPGTIILVMILMSITSRVWGLGCQV